VPATALNHFQQDIARARAVVAHADPLPTGTPAEQLLRSDLFRSGWMFAVGALDAYFCDAYTDIVAATIISKSRHQAQNPPGFELPDFFLEIRFPVRAILEPYDINVNWRWRMAAREMMARENVLSLRTIQELFNKFFRRPRRFFHALLGEWIVHPDARRRLFGITGARFASLTADQQATAINDAWAKMEDRFAAIFQRRHDCIHNCDRPRVSPQPLAVAEHVLRVIEDVAFLVARCDNHINAEFRQFLLDRGCPAAIINQCGY
jgi:hypothetical protein